MTRDTRGVLYPARTPSFHRLPPPEPVAALVRWFWIPEWDLAPGRVSRQHVLGFPACNLVVEPTGVGIAGPTTRRGHRDLEGRGWAVGALLRPAAVPHLAPDPATLLDAYAVRDLPDPHRAVVGAMAADLPPEERRQRAVEVMAEWLLAHVPEPDEQALLANALAELVDHDPAVLRVEHAADRLGVSVRTVQRLARTYVGVPPAAMIRRRRLQEAAERLREDATVDIAQVAAELGYADHAHLTGDFRTVLGFTPRAYRARAARPDDGDDAPEGGRS